LEKSSEKVPILGLPSRSPGFTPAFVTCGDYGVAAFAVAKRSAKAGNFPF
jgi:hypothetical protein